MKRLMVAAPSGDRVAALGGVIGIIGALVLVAACALPYAQSTKGFAGANSFSIFNPRPGHPVVPWLAAEPVAVIVVAITAGVVLVVSTRQIRRAITAGLLIAFGIQTLFLFVGYAGSFGANSASSVYQAGIGSIVGMIGGVCLLVGGLVAASSKGVRGLPRTPPAAG